GLQRIQDAWPTLRRSNLMRHGVLRNDVYLLRARTALANVTGEDARRRLPSIEGDVRRLRRQRRPDTTAHSDLIAAAVAAIRGDTQRSRALLTDAIALYEGAGMTLHAATATLRLAEMGGATGELASAPAAERFIRSLGIHDPAGWLALQAPGFP